MSYRFIDADSSCTFGYYNTDDRYRVFHQFLSKKRDYVVKLDKKFIDDVFKNFEAIK